jgi:hypothetical protein
MPTLRTTLAISASPSKIWAVLSDFSNIQIFHPNVLDVLVLRMAVRSTLNKVLKGLKHHVETGELIGKNWKPTSRIPQSTKTQVQG